MDQLGPASPANDRGTHVVPARYITADLPPLGGRIKERPEDFIVEELPRYQPGGQGEHIYLFIQKRGLSTLEVVRILAQHFGVPEQAVGYAGLKDKQAVTLQTFSVHVPGRKIEAFPSLRHEGIEVAWADYHTNKLRPGHLTGNRFSVRIRGVDAAQATVAARALARLQRTGVPNRFAEQRFGLDLRNHLVGRALVLGDDRAFLDALLGPLPGASTPTTPARELYARGAYAEAAEAFPRSLRTERAVLRALARGEPSHRAKRAVGRAELSFFLSAFQSAVFNAVLDERVLSGTIGTLLPGDLVIKHENHAVFRVDEATTSDPATGERLARFEISPSGPMWGSDMMRATGRTDEVEVAALAATGVTLDHLARFEHGRMGLIRGSRRPLRVPLRYPDVEGGIDEHGHYVRCTFELPRGSFATAVLREIMKPELAGESGAPADETEMDERSQDE